MRAIGGRRWCVALGAALAIHVGVALAMAWPGPPRSGAMMPGLAGLEVSLGAAGGSPGAIEPVRAEAVAVAPSAPVQEAVQPESAQPVAVQPVTAEAVPAERLEPVEVVEPVEAVDVVEAEPVEAVEPVDAVEPVEVVEAVEETPVETVVAELVVAEQPEPAPVPPAKPEVPEVVAAQAAAQTGTVVASADPATAAETGDGPPEAAPVAEAGSAGPGSGADTGVSAGDDTAGGGTPGAVADYYALLQAWLEQHRRYPQRARERRQEGIAYVYFVVDPQGRVLESRLERSSGFPLLDDEVLAMVARAEPMPPIPADMARSSLAIVVPVAFTLR